MRRRRRYRPIGSAENPLADNLFLVGVGVVALVAVGFALWSSSAAASSPNTWPAVQFSTGQGTPGNVVPGIYVLLNDSTTGNNIIAQCTSVSGSAGVGTVIYAPPTASESAGDIVNFNLSNVIASNTSMALLALT
jgi:hypothetical protein